MLLYLGVTGHFQVYWPKKQLKSNLNFSLALTCSHMYGLGIKCTHTRCLQPHTMVLKQFPFLFSLDLCFPFFYFQRPKIVRNSTTMCIMTAVSPSATHTPKLLTSPSEELCRDIKLIAGVMIATESLWLWNGFLSPPLPPLVLELSIVQLMRECAYTSATSKNLNKILSCCSPRSDRRSNSVNAQCHGAAPSALISLKKWAEWAQQMKQISLWCCSETYGSFSSYDVRIQCLVKTREEHQVSPSVSQWGIGALQLPNSFRCVCVSLLM